MVYYVLMKSRLHIYIPRDIYQQLIDMIIREHGKLKKGLIDYYVEKCIENNLGKPIDVVKIPNYLRIEKNLYIDKELHNKLSELALKYGCSITDIVINALSRCVSTIQEKEVEIREETLPPIIEEYVNVWRQIYEDLIKQKQILIHESDLRCKVKEKTGKNHEGIAKEYVHKFEELGFIVPFKELSTDRNVVITTTTTRQTYQSTIHITRRTSGYVYLVMLSGDETLPLIDTFLGMLREADNNKELITHILEEGKLDQYEIPPMIRKFLAIAALLKESYKKYAKTSMSWENAIYQAKLYIIRKICAILKFRKMCNEDINEYKSKVLEFFKSGDYKYYSETLKSYFSTFGLE